MKTEKPFPPHFISLLDWSSPQIQYLLELARITKQKKKKGKLDLSLKQKTLALVFEKSSMRTRVSFQVAMTQLGGASIFLSKNDINLGQREPVKDGSRVLSRYVDAVAARVFKHETVEILARHSEIPVINALSDRYHPCQALADLLTIQESFGDKKPVVAYIGDANNVARSLAIICAKLGYPFRIASPEGYGFDKDFLNLVAPVAKEKNLEIKCFLSPCDAAEKADVLYTDTWVSMGLEAEMEERKKIFKGYRIDAKLQALASDCHIVMHCLPACRGDEITDEALEGSHSVVFNQAENRLHVQRTLLNELIRE